MRAALAHKACVGIAALLIGATLLAGCSDKKKVREPTPLAAISNPAVRPHTVWTASTGGSGKYYSELRPGVEIDAIYTAGLDGRVSSYSLDKGKRLWSVNTKSRVAAGPSVSNDLVLVGTLDAEVIALKRTDGSEVWRAKLSSEALGPPVGEGGIVVARSIDGRVFGLDASNGQRLWNFDRTVPELVLRGISKPLISGTSVIVGMENGRAIALGLTDGEPRWEQAISVPAGRTVLDRLVDIDGDMIEGDDCLYVASFGGEVACLSPTSGEVGWRRGVKSYNSLALGGGKVLVSDESGVVWALDQTSGAAAWKQEGLLYRRLSPPAYFGGYVVVGDFEGYLHWIDPSDGKIVARTRVGSDPIIAQPMVGGDLLYVLNRDGKLAAISLPQKQ
ncbi:outer membrane protein assembly factor BamB [Hydrocarboniphaga sp.]|uniref:outer membrane protein assembly factor BamB n=1 Tax=Hydrocarboniphaga sp. TaxID=2033016 RepID=UPI002AB88E3E|nr:outer membrane protein assembly factor BamB [Hydrocarboniphaga sp.]MDZ4077337.1 outer membrane protein assembly factor BamB [Hydrocarboniphaga sp.]